VKVFGKFFTIEMATPPNALPMKSLLTFTFSTLPPRLRSRRFMLIVLLIAGIVIAGSWIEQQFLVEFFQNRNSPVQATINIRPAANNTILFKTNNGKSKNKVPPVEKMLPHLVLLRNNQLTDPASRTVFFDLDWHLAGNRAALLTFVLETQNGNPDAGGGAMNRVVVWQTQVSLPAAPMFRAKSGKTRLAYTFPAELAAGGVQSNPTPTGYYRLKILASFPGEKAKAKILEEDYALLLENQIWMSLTRPDEPAPGPQALVVYFTDMTPYQINAYGLNNRMPRQAVNTYVEQELVPGMQKILQLMTQDWGFSWHPTWRSFREGDEKNLLTVALTDEDIWYHGPAPEGGYGLISINVHQLKLKTYKNTTEWILSIFGHELFHNLQRSLSLESGATGDIDGRQDAWGIVTEGSAMLIESLLREFLHFSPGMEEDPYTYHMRSFVQTLSTNNSNVKASLRKISPYNLVVYWRFLYDQCSRGLGSDAPTSQRLDIIRATLKELYSQPSLLESTRETLPENFEILMDQVLGLYSHCPYASYADSLASFARGLYALRFEHEDKSSPPLAIDDSLTPSSQQPPSPAPETVSLDFHGAPLTYTDQIAASYGIDFVEVTLIGADRECTLEVDFQCLSSDAARYQLQVVQIDSEGPAIAGPADDAQQVIFSGYTTEGGTLHFLLNGLDPALASRLGIIVTRVDSREQEDLSGSYQIDIRSASVVERQ
jgi:hypothetical protein